ncbi:hypothetical protein J6590_052721 [Homalodisca vitripennis]|nr:hypothetical protein J6590_052721 [Homalodisca vitripennis]
MPGFSDLKSWKLLETFWKVGIHHILRSPRNRGLLDTESHQRTKATRVHDFLDAETY